MYIKKLYKFTFKIDNLPAQPRCGYKFCPGENRVCPADPVVLPGEVGGPPLFGGWKADEVILDPAEPIMESDSWDEVAVEEAFEAAMAAAAAAAAVLPNMGRNAPAAAAEKGNLGSMKWWRPNPGWPMWWDSAKAPGRPPGKASRPFAPVGVGAPTPRAAAARPPRNGLPGRSFKSP